MTFQMTWDDFLATIITCILIGIIFLSMTSVGFYIMTIMTGIMVIFCIYVNIMDE